MSNNKDDIGSKVFFNKYKPEKKWGEGSFGKIYSAVNVTTGEQFALKIELKDSNKNLLENEAYFLCYLKGFGIPYVKSYGFSGNYNIMVMQWLGKSLEDLFRTRKLHFSIKTVCMLTEQMLVRMEFIHNRHIIHRDIKPDNFVMGVGMNCSTVYLIDFGLAKKYRSFSKLEHVKFSTNKKLTGTARYASINALRGCEQSRRDDLEAIGYVIMYFLRGSLPWQGLHVDKREDRYQKIYEKKKSTTPEDLCSGFPMQLTEYIKYTRNLKFEQTPDYDLWKHLWRSIIENKYENDWMFDWLKETSCDINNKNVSNKYKDKQRKDYVNTKDNEKDIDNVNKEECNKYCFTFQNGENARNIEKRILKNERVNTRYVNYNTTVQVTEDNNQGNNYIDNNEKVNVKSEKNTETKTEKEVDDDWYKNKKDKWGKCIIF